MIALFSPAHTEPMKTEAITTAPVNMLTGFMNLRGQRIDWWQDVIEAKIKVIILQFSFFNLCFNVIYKKKDCTYKYSLSYPKSSFEFVLDHILLASWEYKHVNGDT